MISAHRLEPAPSGEAGRAPRAREVRAVVQALALAADGQGSVILVEGVPGIGKSHLVDLARRRAGEVGVRALEARGCELESAFSFGVVRQLLEAPLATLPEAERDQLLTGAAGLAAPLLAERRRRPRPGAPAPETSGLHGLYWLAAKLARDQPLLLCVDDAQWADEPSLRWLNYLAGRIRDLPVLLLVATRPVREGTGADLLATLERAPCTTVVELAPLDLEGTREVIAGGLAAEPDDAFVAVCDRLAAGNPLLLVELLRSLRAERLAPEASSVERLFAAGPESLSRAALGRLRGLGPEVVELTRAVAVLEHGALWTAAGLAGLGLAQAQDAAHALVAVGVLADRLPLEFVHPLIRSCVYHDLSAPQRSAAHLRAARLLADEGADGDHVVAHLLHVEPSHEPWVVEALRDAARGASVRGASDVALRYLRRALIELPAAERPPELLAELGRAEVRTGDAEAGIAHLRASLHAAGSAPARAAAARELGGALIAGGEPGAAAEVLTAVLDDIATGAGDGAPAADCAEWLRLDSALAVARLMASAGPAEAGPLRVTPAPDVLDRCGERASRGLAALEASLQSAGFGAATAHARAALADGVPPAEADDPTLPLPAIALIYAERPGWACDALGYLLEAVSQAGAERAIAWSGAWRALASLRAGRLEDAELDARRALEICERTGAAHASEPAAAALVETLVDRGRLPDAEEIVTRYGGPGGGLFAAHGWYALGRLREAQGRLDEAEAALRACGAIHAAWRSSSPAASPWRACLPLVIAAAGRAAEARGLAADALTRARGGDSLLALGSAQRAAGLLAPEPDGRIDLLRQAVGTLRETECRLELARALLDLGAELRRAGLRREARATLSEAHAVAVECGAEPLADKAAGDLGVLRAKPRRGARADRDALTAAEHRVASLAARGATNRRIADELVVTPKTVEYHLTSIYRKLDISSRDELAGALSAAASAV